MFYEPIILPNEPRTAGEVMFRARQRCESKKLEALRDQARELRKRLDEAEGRARLERHKRVLVEAELLRMKERLALPDLLEPIDKLKYSARRVLAAVARAHNLPVGYLTAPTRQHHHVIARFHAIHILSTRRTDLSSTSVGRIFGRDHSTIINAKKEWPKYAPLCALEIFRVKEALDGQPVA